MSERISDERLAELIEAWEGHEEIAGPLAEACALRELQERRRADVPHTSGHINCPGCAKAQIDAYGPASRLQ